MAELELDPRWDWIAVHTWGEPGPQYIKGYCNHLEIVPVEDVEGVVVAHLCQTCDSQMPAEYTAHRMVRGLDD